MKTTTADNPLLEEPLLFLGFAVPDEMMESISKYDHYPQMQTHKLQWNIIRGIEVASASCIRLLSAVPVISCYPKYPGVLFRGGPWKHRKDAHDLFIPFLNIIILKHVTRFISTFLYVSKWLVGNRRDPKILIYAMHSPIMLAAVAATRLFGGKMFLVIPDLPEFMDIGMRRNRFWKLAKRIDSYVMKRMLRRMTGLVVLTKYIAQDGFSGMVPYLVMEGAVSTEVASADSEPSVGYPDNEKIIMYTGHLMGLELLTDAFLLIPDKAYRLWITGRGDWEERISKLSSKDKRIVYWGFLANEEIVQKMKQATVLVNPRSSATPHIKYSFPSKLLEYMLTGKPVISTALPGIPDDYYDHLYILEEESPQALASLIQEVCSKPAEELREFGESSRRFVMTQKNYRRQGERIYEFMQSL